MKSKRQDREKGELRKTTFRQNFFIYVYMTKRYVKKVFQLEIIENMLQSNRIFI